MIAIQQGLQPSNKEAKIVSRDIQILTRSQKSIESDIRKILHDLFNQLDEFL